MRPVRTCRGVERSTARRDAVARGHDGRDDAAQVPTADTASLLIAFDVDGRRRARPRRRSTAVDGGGASALERQNTICVPSAASDALIYGFLPLRCHAPSNYNTIRGRRKKKISTKHDSPFITMTRHDSTRLTCWNSGDERLERRTGMQRSKTWKTGLQCTSALLIHCSGRRIATLRRGRCASCRERLDNDDSCSNGWVLARRTSGGARDDDDDDGATTAASRCASSEWTRAPTAGGGSEASTCGGWCRAVDSEEEDDDTPDCERRSTASARARRLRPLSCSLIEAPHSAAATTSDERRRRQRRVTMTTSGDNCRGERCLSWRLQKMPRDAPNYRS